MFHYASALENYTRDEPLAWSDFYIDRGRLLAQTLSYNVGEGERARAQQLLATAPLKKHSTEQQIAHESTYKCPQAPCDQQA